MRAAPPLRLFQATGVEVEYMIVDRETLSVRPIADELIKAEVGGYESEIERGAVAWSNELALHVVELKTNGPARSLQGLAAAFQANVAHINQLLVPLHAQLLPSGMHPWMDPIREMRLWPHAYSPVYQAFDRVFDCRGHGWANLQSTHINLPFGDDDEFGRLHAAIRLVLPIVPALAASSPVVDGAVTGWLDTRLRVYQTNARRVPSVSGAVIPEPLFTRARYEGELLAHIYSDLAPHDPEGTLRYEWVNARGCIARFDRDAIEIRLVDAQECPLADVAVTAAVRAAVQWLASAAGASQDLQRAWPTERLADLLWKAAQNAEAAVIDDRAYCELFNYAGRSPCTARDLWQHLIDTTLAAESGFDEWRDALQVILSEGCLARRILRRLGADTRREHLHAVYGELAQCLARGVMFRAT